MLLNDPECQSILSTLLGPENIPGFALRQVLIDVLHTNSFETFVRALGGGVDMESENILLLQSKLEKRALELGIDLTTRVGASNEEARNLAIGSNPAQLADVMDRLNALPAKEEFLSLKKITKPRSAKQSGAPCGCNAKVHGLYGNCTSCGYILCTEESSAHCVYCGSRIDHDIYEGAGNEDYAKAIELLTRLLRYQNEHATRCVIRDLDASLFNESISIWNDAKTQQMYRELIKTASEDVAVDCTTKLQIDLENQRMSFILNNPIDPLDKVDALLPSIHNASASETVAVGSEAGLSRLTIDSEIASELEKVVSAEPAPINTFHLQVEGSYHLSQVDCMSNFLLSDMKQVKNLDRMSVTSSIFEDDINGLPNEAETSTINHEARKLSLEDLTEMSFNDHGACIALPQPFATLIAAGLLKSIPLSFNTDYRGFIWIASQEPVTNDTTDQGSDISDALSMIFSDGVPPAGETPLQYEYGKLLGRVYLSKTTIDQSLQMAMYEFSHYQLLAISPTLDSLKPGIFRLPVGCCAKFQKSLGTLYSYN